MNSNIKNKLQETSQLIRENLKEILSLFPAEEELFEAIRYSVLAESARIRGFMMLEFSNLFNVHFKDALEVASAIEMIHSFSLIHDDLPALDNSPERRKQPACHIAFPESTAILAGDALLVLAYQMLSPYGTGIIQDTSKYALEMIAGQVHDLKKDKAIPSNEINMMKTGALFALSCSCVVHLCNKEKNYLETLKKFGYEFGLLFQIVDDIKDNEAGDYHREMLVSSLKRCREMVDTSFMAGKKAVLHELLDYVAEPVLSTS